MSTRSVPGILALTWPLVSGQIPPAVNILCALASRRRSAMTSVSLAASLAFMGSIAIGLCMAVGLSIAQRWKPVARPGRDDLLEHLARRQRARRIGVLAGGVDADLAGIDRLLLGHGRVERKARPFFPNRVVAVGLHARGQVPGDVAVIVDVAVV